MTHSIGRATRTALVVLVPEAERLVGDVRARHDPVAASGVAAHVTLLFPFVPPQAVSAEVLATLRSLFAAAPVFHSSFRSVRRWPEEAWLAPEPDAPFVALTERLVEAFPGYAPYGGRHSGIVPHLTVAQGSAVAAEQAAQEVEISMAKNGPVDATLVEAALLEECDGTWRTLQMFPFRRGETS